MNENPYTAPFGELAANQTTPARRTSRRWMAVGRNLGVLWGLVIGLTFAIRNGSLDDLLDGPRVEHLLIVGLVIFFGAAGAGLGAILAALLKPATRE